MNTAKKESPVRVRIDAKVFGDFSSSIEAVEALERRRPRRGETALIMGPNVMQVWGASLQVGDTGALELVWMRK